MIARSASSERKTQGEREIRSCLNSLPAILKIDEPSLVAPTPSKMEANYIYVLSKIGIEKTLIEAAKLSYSFRY